MTPATLQALHDTDCGPFAAAFVIRWFDRPIPASLQSQLDATSGACSLHDLQEWIADAGLTASATSMGPEDLFAIATPTILHLESSEQPEDAPGHFVVFLGPMDGTSYSRVLDLTNPQLTAGGFVENELLMEAWSGHAVITSAGRAVIEPWIALIGIAVLTISGFMTGRLASRR